MSVYMLLLLVGLIVPMLLTLFSKRASGATKMGWVIIVLIFSWIGYALFLIFAPMINNLTSPTNKNS